MAVREQHELYVVRIESELAQARQHHGLHLIGVAGVDQRDSRRRLDRPDHGARSSERVEVVEHARRGELRIVGTVCSRCVAAAEEVDGLGPLSPRRGARVRDELGDPRAIRRHRCRARRLSCARPCCSENQQEGESGRSSSHACSSLGSRSIYALRTREHTNDARQNRARLSQAFGYPISAGACVAGSVRIASWGQGRR